MTIPAIKEVCGTVIQKARKKFVPIRLEVLGLMTVMQVKRPELSESSLRVAVSRNLMSAMILSPYSPTSYPSSSVTSLISRVCREDGDLSPPGAVST